MGTAERKSNRNSAKPLLAKIIILVQSAVILLFTVGMYQEYLSNSYLQTYVVRLFTSNLVADTMLSMVTLSVFAIGTFTLLGSMSTTKKLGKEWRVTAEPAKEALNMPTMPVLEKAEPLRRSPRKRRQSQSRPRVDSNDIFQSMIDYTNRRQD